MKKVINWIKNHLPSRRRIIQLFSAALINANALGFVEGKIFKGPTKAICQPGINCYSCPGAIAACPIGSIQSALKDSNKSTIFFVWGTILLYGLIFGRTICSHICPFGLVQDLLYKIKSFKIKKGKATRILSYLKYIILFVMVIAIPLAFANVGLVDPAFCKFICPAGTLEGALLLGSHPANALSVRAILDVLFSWKMTILIGFILFSIVLYRPFCRFICPLGAIYGFFNKLSFLGVTVKEDKCTSCGLCVSKCKMDVNHVGDHECISCGECISVCPSNAIEWKTLKLQEIRKALKEEKEGKKDE